ncbi:MAG: MAE_28990/MAE_18760 family HEPN-like nuclease [Holosporales bacterium]
MEDALLKLQRLLDEESSKRKKELETAKQLAFFAREDETLYLCRSWIVFLFAHCEQFLKQATFHYLSIVNEFKVEHDLNAAWHILYGEEKIIKSSPENYVPPNKLTKSLIFSDFLKPDLKGKLFTIFSFNLKTLRFFFDLVLKSSIQHADWTLFCSSITYKRNRIAHGEEAFITGIEECEFLHTKTFNFMDALKDDLIKRMSCNIEIYSTPQS